jgi:hypothetical protein
VPVFYGYFIPFKFENAKKGSKNCAPDSSIPNVCTTGSAWIRGNRDYLRGVYDTYAKEIAALWGTNRPLIWLFEPDFDDYVSASQTEPLTLQELSAVASDLIGTIQARLPNALISHFAAADIADFGAYFGALDLTRVDLVNTTGAATSEYFKPEFQQSHPNSTYRNLRDATGLPIYVDTGFYASDVSNHGWLTSAPSVINQRIAEGVIGAHVEPPTDSEQAQIDALNPQLSPLDCARH